MAHEPPERSHPAAARRHTLSREAAALLLDVGGRDLAVRRFGRGGTRPEPLVRGGHGSRRGGARARHGHGGRRGADRGARRGERPDRVSGRRVARPRRLPPRRQRARAARRVARDSRTARSGEGGGLHSDAPRSRGRIHGEERARMAGAGDGAPHSHRVGAALVGAAPLGALCRARAPGADHRPVGSRGRAQRARRGRAPGALLEQRRGTLHPHRLPRRPRLHPRTSQRTRQVSLRASVLPAAVDAGRGGGARARLAARARERCRRHGVALRARCEPALPCSAVVGRDRARHLRRAGDPRARRARRPVELRGRARAHPARPARRDRHAGSGRGARRRAARRARPPDPLGRGSAPRVPRGRSRHIQLIAIGGTIGVGLFLGSARAIHNAGPALVLAYALGGIAIFFIMRALGELLTYRPVAGSFATYADEFCGPFAGFVTGWSYWFAWIATAMAELTAIGVYVRWWPPAVPPPSLPVALPIARAIHAN